MFRMFLTSSKEELAKTLISAMWSTPWKIKNKISSSILMFRIQKYYVNTLTIVGKKMLVNLSRINPNFPHSLVIEHLYFLPPELHHYWISNMSSLILCSPRDRREKLKVWKKPFMYILHLHLQSLEKILIISLDFLPTNFQNILFQTEHGRNFKKPRLTMYFFNSALL